MLTGSRERSGYGTWNVSAMADLRPATTDFSTAIDAIQL